MRSKKKVLTHNASLRVNWDHLDDPIVEGKRRREAERGEEKGGGEGREKKRK